MINLDLPYDFFNDIIYMNYESIRRNFPLIGEGSGRIVFQIENDFVLKFPKNKMGALQSKVENNIYDKCETKLRKYLCPIYMYKNDRLIMLRTMPLIQIVGYKGLKINQVFRMKNEESFYKDIERLAKKNDLLVPDVMAVSSWGIINDKKPYLIDYGCTNKLYDKYF